MRQRRCPAWWSWHFPCWQSTRRRRNPPADVSIPREAIQAALKLLGVPYVPGGISRTGVDCSGLVYRVLRDTAGMEVSRGVGGLFHSGTPVTYPMHIGDLVFFDTESKVAPSVPCHVGIYAGGGRFIHAASEGPPHRSHYLPACKPVLP